MMHFHYHTLLKIAQVIRQDAQGAILAEAYTQEKDQVLIAFASPTRELYLRVACAAPLPYIWPMRQGHKAKKNVLDLFQPAYGLHITSVETVPYERVLLIHLEQDYTLALKMHGVLANVILLQAGQVVERFRQNHDPDAHFVPTPGPFDHDWEATADHGEGLPVMDRMRLISPIFEKNFARRCTHWINQGHDFKTAFKQVLAEAEDDNFYIVQDPKRLQFLLFPPEEGQATQYTDVREALDLYLRTWYQYDTYARQYDTASKALQKHLQRLHGQMASHRTTIHKIDTERPPEELGHLIMANLHLLTQGTEYAELHDFYHDTPIKIKLRPELNPQQNAEEYYNKHKKHKSRVRHLELQLVQMEDELLQWLEAEEAFAKLTPPPSLPRTATGLDTQPAKALAAFLKQYGTLLSEGKHTDQERKHPFIEFQSMGYTILVGKNAKQNDQLTFQYSKKTDIWLHARDAFGSHVIVRNPQDRDLPNPVLEYAASIAARFSKRKHESLVPVQYTPRKYVRKMKNGAPGQVTLEREKVLMVAPLESAD